MGVVAKEGGDAGAVTLRVQEDANDDGSAECERGALLGVPSVTCGSLRVINGFCGRWECGHGLESVSVRVFGGGGGNCVLQSTADFCRVDDDGV